MLGMPFFLLLSLIALLFAVPFSELSVSTRARSDGDIGIDYLFIAVVWSYNFESTLGSHRIPPPKVLAGRFSSPLQLRHQQRRFSAISP